MDQYMSLVRLLVPILSSALATFGLISVAQVPDTTNLIMTVIGALGTAVSAFLTWRANSKAAILTAAANIPQVKKIEVAPVVRNDPKEEAEVEKLVQTTPSEVVAKL